MTAVGAILRYSPIEPIFENSSHERPSSMRPTSSPGDENCTLFVVLPNQHIWAPHTRQRAVFLTSSRSRASTTLVVEHHCPEGYRGHPSFDDGIHVPLLRKAENIPCPERSRRRSWHRLTDQSSGVLSRRLSQLIHGHPREVQDTKATSNSLL